jgi:hypothetical protein
MKWPADLTAAHDTVLLFKILPKGPVKAKEQKAVI